MKYNHWIHSTALSSTPVDTPSRSCTPMCSVAVSHSRASQKACTFFGSSAKFITRSVLAPMTPVAAAVRSSLHLVILTTLFVTRDGRICLISWIWHNLSKQLVMAFFSGDSSEHVSLPESLLPAITIQKLEERGGNGGGESPLKSPFPSHRVFSNRKTMWEELLYKTYQEATSMHRSCDHNNRTGCHMYLRTYVALIYLACLQHVGCVYSVALLIQIALTHFQMTAVLPLISKPIRSV